MRGGTTRQYREIKQLGAGSFGTVVLVADESHRRYCLKKVNIGKLSAKERHAAMQEARVLHKFDHPNIVKYKEQFIEGSNLCIVMELAEDGDLHKRLRQQRGRPLPISSVLDWFVQICRAMQHVHSHKVLHRDIKPQNIFLSSGGSVIKVGDFGISRVLHNTHEMARTKVGTPYYLSPEICNGQPYDHKSDIWSLGCVLYELVALKTPFNGSNLAALLLAITRGRFKPPAVSTHCPQQLRDLIVDMLRLEPDKRPDIVEVLERTTALLTVELNRKKMTQEPTSSPKCVAPAAVVCQSRRHIQSPRAELRRGKIQQRASPASPAKVQVASKPPTPNGPAYPVPRLRGENRPNKLSRPKTRQGWNHYVPRRRDGCLGEQRQLPSTQARNAKHNLARQKHLKVPRAANGRDEFVWRIERVRR